MKIIIDVGWGMGYGRDVSEKYHLLSVPNGFHIFIGSLDEALRDCQARNEWAGTTHIVKSFSNREDCEKLLFKKLGW